MSKFLPFGLLVFSLNIFFNCRAQQLESNYYPEFNSKKFNVVVAGGVGLYFGTLTGLYAIWYEDKNRTNFHWFDDNQGWMQVDKFGHMYSAYILGKVGYRSLRWSGIERKKAILYGGSYGFLFLTSIEILDGHYEEWGASAGDIESNALGSALFISQELVFNKQIVSMKFSYNPTPLAEKRTDLLGEGTIERVIKDYNGQTYWFSLNYKSIFRNHNFAPKWLNLAGGYSAYGMLGGMSNPTHLPYVERYRRYFFSLDIDFDKIRSKSKFVNSILFVFNTIKFPFPTLEFNSKGEVIFHPIYF